MKTRIHYAISDNPSPSICGRFSENYTRIVGCVTCKQCKTLIQSKHYSLAQFVKHDGECDGCEFQDGKYCSWWKSETDCPPCQQHKPDEKLTATYYNFSPCHNLTSDEMLDTFFSCFACQTCGSKLHGDRHYCTATIGKAHTNLREKLEICTDCYLYFFT